MLVGTGQAAVVARAGAPPEDTARRLNQAAARAVLRSGRTEGGTAMASFRLGAGLACVPVEQLVWLMLAEQAADNPQDWARRAGMSADSALQFRGVAETLIERRLPLWRAAGLC